MPQRSSEQEPSNSEAGKLRTFGLLGGCGAVAILLQTSVLPALPFAPDLLLIVCVYLGIYHRSVGGAAWAFFLGYALDSCSGLPVGAHTLAMSLVFSAAALMSQSLWMNNPVSVCGLIAMAVLLKMVTFLFLHEVEWVSVLFLPLVARYVLWDVLASILLTPLIFALLTVGERAPSRA